VPDRNAAMAGTGPSPGPALAEMAKGLERAGADFLVMPCNAAHAFAEAIITASGLPFLDMIEATADAALTAAPRAGRIGVLAVSACLDAGLYQRALAERGVEPLTPEGALRDRLMAAIYAVKADDLAAGRAGIAAVAEELVALGAEALIAGCTEVPLGLCAAETPVPLINSTQVLAERTVECATSKSIDFSACPYCHPRRASQRR
jgi:aspartate racemase